MLGNLCRVWHHLPLDFVNERRPEVYEDVYDKHDVDNQIEDDQRLRVAGGQAFPGPRFRLLVELGPSFVVV